MAFTTDNWVGTASADWGTSSSNWSTGLPNSNNNVVINTTAVLTVTYSGSDSLTTVNALTVVNDVFDMTGGNLVIATNASFSSGFVQTGGVFTGGPITIKGSGTFNELTFASAEGKTAFTVNAALTIGTYTLGGASVLNNAKTISETSQITLGDGTGVNAEINNKKGAIFSIGGDFGVGAGAASAQFINAGTLQKIAGINGTFIDVGFIDTGKIVVATGTLEFRAGTDSFAGAISGNGEFAIGGGSKDAINAGTTISTATFAITDGGTVATLGESLGYAKTFMLQNGAQLDINGVNRKLTLSGTTFLVNAEIGGTGTLTTTVGSSTDVNGFTLGGGVDWQNSGTVGSVGLLQLGDSTFNAATFFNEKGAVYELTNDVGMQTGRALNSSFINMAGASLEKVGGGGVSTIGVELTDNGGIVIQTGTMNFTGVADTFTGVISGNGQFEIGGGSSTFGAAAAITTETFTISAATATLGENLSYLSGAFNFVNFSVLSLGGFSFTVSGNDSFNRGTVDGTGTLITDKNSSVSLSMLTLGSAAKWQNSGTVFEFSTLQIGDQSFDKASFVNERGGRFILAADTGISVGFNVDFELCQFGRRCLCQAGGRADHQRYRRGVRQQRCCRGRHRLDRVPDACQRQGQLHDRAGNGRAIRFKRRRGLDYQLRQPYRRRSPPSRQPGVWRRDQGLRRRRHRRDRAGRHQRGGRPQLQGHVDGDVETGDRDGHERRANRPLDVPRHIQTCQFPRFAGPPRGHVDRRPAAAPHITRLGSLSGAAGRCRPSAVTASSAARSRRTLLAAKSPNFSRGRRI